MKREWIFLTFLIVAFACDQDCQSKCTKQNKGKSCYDSCQCESPLPPPLEEFVAKGNQYSLPKIKQDEKLWAERELGCDVTSLEICLQLAQKGEDKYQCAVYSGCEDLLVEQKKGQIIEVTTTSAECTKSCNLLCIGIESGELCKNNCQEHFCTGKENTNEDGFGLSITIQLILIFALGVTLLLTIRKQIIRRAEKRRWDEPLLASYEQNRFSI
ncbi:unnamed protein product [Blepharisma stoltei]|uniref:Uncharacterized protein n=1 Tax=Blepharisma stoltei TaxID=1481888 RepID=A0AAU9IQH0_9CILI|nr:unnamed protein product [Blepharisma stoltei]